LADIYVTFDKEGIEIPFPTQDINFHLKDDHIAINAPEVKATGDAFNDEPNKGENDKTEDIGTDANKNPSDPAK